MADFIRVEGSRFVSGGKPVFLRGLGVGSWLNLEHFMMGVPGWDGQLRKCLDEHCPGFMQRFTENFFGIEDARYIRSLGVNFIRVPINHHLFWDDQTDAPREYGLEQLERLAHICEETGLYFLPDLHTTPGGQNPDWHSESKTGTAQFWEFASLRKNAVAIWREIAKRLKECHALLGYDLLNEPVLPKGATGLLNNFYADAAAAIREEDKNHILFLEGDRFSMDFAQIQPLSDDNWAYAYHFYPGVWDEKLTDTGMDEQTRRQAFIAALQEILDSMGAYRGPLLCGEMGYELSRLDAEFGIRLTKTTIEALEAHQSGWCLWCYKDAKFMGLAYPAELGGWMQLVHTVRRGWNHHKAANIGQATVDALETMCPYKLTEEEKYGMQFVVRSMAAKADVAHILNPALKALPKETRDRLPDDFAFSKCERNPGLEALLKDSCGA